MERVDFFFEDPGFAVVVVLNGEVEVCRDVPDVLNAVPGVFGDALQVPIDILFFLLHFPSPSVAVVFVVCLRLGCSLWCSFCCSFCCL